MVLILDPCWFVRVSQLDNHLMALKSKTIHSHIQYSNFFLAKRELFVKAGGQRECGCSAGAVWEAAFFAARGHYWIIDVSKALIRAKFGLMFHTPTRLLFFVVEFL